MWPNTKKLLTHQLKQHIIPLIGSMAFFLLMGFMAGGMLISLEHMEDESAFALMIQYISVDWVNFAMICVIGHCFTKESFNFVRKDSYSRTLAFYRKFPVTNREITAARFAEFLLILPVLAACYYTPYFFVARTQSGLNLTASGFITVVLVWLGITLLAGGFYLFLELGYSGKAYLLRNFMVVGTALVVLVILNLCGIHLVYGSFTLARQVPVWIPPVISLAIGGASLWLWYGKTVQRLTVRDLL